MSGALSHRPAHILQQLLVDMSLGVQPGTSPWPIHVSHMPDSPDDCLCVYDTDGRQGGRSGVDGERDEYYGIQIKARQAIVTNPPKLDAVKVYLDETLYRATVTIDGISYLVQAFTRTGNILQLGPENPTSRRRLMTLNGTVSLSQVSS